MPDLMPIACFADLADLGPRRFLATVHSHPKYYRRPDLPGGWGQTREALRLQGGVAVADEGVHSLRVRRDGLVVASHCGHDLAFRLRGIVGLVADGTETVAREIDLSAWGLDLSGLDRGVVAWDGPAGIRYEVRYIADQVRDRFVLTDQGRDWIRARLPAGAARFGLAFDCSLPPGLVRTVDAKAAGDFDTEAPVLLSAGTIRQWLRPSVILDPRLLTLDPSAAGWRERWALRGTHLVQAVPLAALDAAAELNTSVTYENGVGSPPYAGCTDNMLDSKYPDGNANTLGLKIGSQPANADRYRTLIRFDLSALSGVTSINSATLELYKISQAGAGSPMSTTAYRVLRAWSQLTSTYNSASTGVSWGTAGCSNTSTDRTATGDTSSIEGTDSQFKSFNVATAVTAWLVGGQTNYGWLLQWDNEATGDRIYIYRDSEYATAALRPKLTIDYETGGGGGFLAAWAAATNQLVGASS